MWLIAVLAPGAFILVAWMLWLLFNCLIAKWYGLEGLKATPPLAAAFNPRDWALTIIRYARGRQLSQGEEPCPGSDAPAGKPGHDHD
jgi:hypothetical protein